MNNITIPTVGSHLILTEDWTFALYPERRNSSVWNILVGQMPNWHEQYIRCGLSIFSAVTLPKWTILIVDRIYIRQNSPDFDSVSFRIRECASNPKLAKKRFWAKLQDVNRVDAVWDEGTIPRRDGPPSLPDEVVIPPSKLPFFRETLPDGLRAEIYEQAKLGNELRTREFTAKLIRGVLHVFETIDGQEVEIWSHQE
jgi:hypothetical protein